MCIIMGGPKGRRVISQTNLYMHPPNFPAHAEQVHSLCCAIMMTGFYYIIRLLAELVTFKCYLTLQLQHWTQAAMQWSFIYRCSINMDTLRMATSLSIMYNT